MKIYFSLVLCVLSNLAGISQMSLFGNYNFYEFDSNKIQEEINLNCDSTFTLIKSTQGILMKGKWAVKNGNELVLFLDPVLKLNSYADLTTVLFLIKGNQLYNPGKIETKRQYHKRTKKLKRKLTKETGEVQNFESYEKFKERQQNSYFKQIAIFNCK